MQFSAATLYKSGKSSFFRKIFLIYTLLICFALFSCATLATQEELVEREAVSLVSALNEGNSRTVERKIMHPFLLDTEIILQEQDIKTFWQDYIETGISLGNPEIISVKKVESADYKEFGESMDIKIFFKKYLPPVCYLVKIKSANRLYTFLISPGTDVLPAFYGYKGASL